MLEDRHEHALRGRLGELQRAEHVEGADHPDHRHPGVFGVRPPEAHLLAQRVLVGPVELHEPLIDDDHAIRAEPVGGTEPPAGHDGHVDEVEELRCDEGVPPEGVLRVVRVVAIADAVEPEARPQDGQVRGDGCFADPGQGLELTVQALQELPSARRVVVRRRRKREAGGEHAGAIQAVVGAAHGRAALDHETGRDEQRAGERDLDRDQGR